MDAIEKTEQALRRGEIQNWRKAVRAGVEVYASHANRRFEVLRRLGIPLTDDATPRLRLALRSMVKAKRDRNWHYNRSKHLAILQALGGEMIWQDERPLNEFLAKQRHDQMEAQGIRDALRRHTPE